MLFKKESPEFRQRVGRSALLFCRCLKLRRFSLVFQQVIAIYFLVAVGPQVCQYCCSVLYRICSWQPGRLFAWLHSFYSLKNSHTSFLSSGKFRVMPIRIERPMFLLPCLVKVHIGCVIPSFRANLMSESPKFFCNSINCCNSLLRLLAITIVIITIIITLFNELSNEFIMNGKDSLNLLKLMTIVISCWFLYFPLVFCYFVENIT